MTQFSLEATRPVRVMPEQEPGPADHAAAEPEVAISCSVIVPVYRGEATLPELCRRLTAVFADIGLGYEIILVNDDSPDNSWEVMQTLHADDPHIKIIRLQRNFGQHAAVLCGMRYAKGELVVTIDDDLQYFPEDIPKLISTLQRDGGCDAVFGIPAQKKHAFYRNLGSRALNSITAHIFQRDKSLRMSSFRIFRRDTTRHILNLRIPEPAIGTMLFLVTKRVRNVEVNHAERSSGRSGYSILKVLRLTFNSIINYSSLPLQIVSQIGLISALVSLALTVYYLIKSRTVSVSGWSSIVVLVTFFSGLVLLTLGIIGEYLIRILKAVNVYPQYLVACSRGVEEDEKSTDSRYR